jgi:CheY-like chemotaxis protein
VGTRTIYLAEDDFDDQEFLQEAFSQLDPAINLVCFTSGLRFMKSLTSLADDMLPTLIVLDYNIPELNGEEILQQLQKHDRFSAIPKIVWSTSDSPLYRENCLSFGAQAYLVKPSSINGISEIAREMLRYSQVKQD